MTVTRAAQVELDGVPVAFTFHRVPRRKHLHVVVDENAEVHVRAPWRCSLAGAEQAVREHAAWVIEALARARSRVRERPRLTSGVTLPFLDERLELRITDDVAQLRLLPTVGRSGTGRFACRWGRVIRRGQRLDVAPAAFDEAVTRRLLEAWYRREARAALVPRLDRLAARLGRAPARVAIRAQRTCWGSCSSRGTVSLNWRLVLLPGDLADYVIAHELCHLVHLDHSPRFWAEVGRLVPDYPERRRRLGETQAFLVL